MDKAAKNRLSFFACASLLLVLMPNSLGIRDGASVAAQRPFVDAHWRRQFLPSPFGTIDRAIFILPNPIGTAVADFPGYRLVRPDARDRVAMGSVPSKPSEQNHLDPVLAHRVAPAGLNHLAKIDPRGPGPGPVRNETPEPQIQTGPATVKVGAPALPPLAYTRFCLQYPDDCQIRGNDFRRRTVALTPERWTELIEVDRRVNRDIIPQPDGGGATAEVWLLNPKVGACHDYAVTKRHDLLASGWPSRALLLSEVITASGEHHLILVVRTNEGDIVLDNLNADILPVEDIDYQWVRIQSASNPNFWFSVVPHKVRSMYAGAGASRT